MSTAIERAEQLCNESVAIDGEDLPDLRELVRLARLGARVEQAITQDASDSNDPEVWAWFDGWNAALAWIREDDNAGD